MQFARWPKTPSPLRGRQRAVRALFKALHAAANSGRVERWSVKYGAVEHRIRGHMTFVVQIEEDEIDGGYIAECLDLPGCMSQGETEEEAVKNLTEAIAGVLEVRMRRHLAEAKPRAVDASEHQHPHRRALQIPVT